MRKTKITIDQVKDFVKKMQVSRLSAQRIVDHLAGFKTAAQLSGTLTQAVEQEIADWEQYFSSLAFKKGAPVGDRPIIDLFQRRIFPQRGDTRV